MDVQVAKEYLHIRDWLALAQEIVDAGEQAYLEEFITQEAGDSIMMKRLRRSCHLAVPSDAARIFALG